MIENSIPFFIMKVLSSGHTVLRAGTSTVWPFEEQGMYEQRERTVGAGM